MPVKRYATRTGGDIIKKRYENYSSKKRAEQVKRAQKINPKEQEIERRIAMMELENKNRKAEEERSLRARRQQEEDDANDDKVLERWQNGEQTREVADLVRNAKLRSQLQHAVNAQVTERNNAVYHAPRPDDVVNRLWDTALNNIPGVGDVKQALGVTIGRGMIHCKPCNKKMKQSSWRKHQLSQSHGAGLGDWLRQTFSKRLDSFNNISSRTLAEYGNCKIVGISAAKKPIDSVLDKVINFVSLGKWAELKKKYSYDQLMHLGLIINVRLPSGEEKSIMCEKVDAVTIQPRVTISGQGAMEYRTPFKPDSYTLLELITKARQMVGDKVFFDYNAFSNNCQFFCSYILKACNVWTPPVAEFVMQDISELSKEMPTLTKTIMQATTDLGQIVNHVTGAGLVIQHIQVKKTVPFTEAMKHAQHILKTKRKFKEKVVGQSWHFKAIPKTKIKKGTFRTKKINGTISIVLGELI